MGAIEAGAGSCTTSGRPVFVGRPRTTSDGLPATGPLAYVAAVTRPKAKAAFKMPRKAAPRVVALDDADDRHQAKQARAALDDPKNRKRVPWSAVKTTLGL